MVDIQRGVMVTRSLPRITPTTGYSTRGLLLKGVASEPKASPKSAMEWSPYLMPSRKKEMRPRFLSKSLSEWVSG